MKHLRQQDAKRNSVNGREEENFVVLFVDFGLMPDRGSVHATIACNTIGRIEKYFCQGIKWEQPRFIIR